MRRMMIWALLLVGAVVAGTSSATAAVGLLGDRDDHGVCGDFEGCIAECDGSLGGGGDFSQVSDQSHDLTREASRDQTVDIDEDTVLLGIALANNGARGIDWNALRTFDLTASREHHETRTADFERDDVFSALALGVDSSSSSLDALACVSDVAIDVTEEVSISRAVVLDEDNVLLAIALANSVNSPLEFEDIASISESESESVTRSSTVEIDREDAFLALALGAGGG